MTPKEKARELVDKFYQQAPLEDIKFYSNDVMAKDCALIAVDEIEKEIFTYYERFDYWKEVKQEIEKL
jgi:hypothetical protein